MWRGGSVAVTGGGLLLLLAIVAGNYPQFDTNTQMRELLLPSDARVGSIVYRLRATDSDREYPLHFAATDYGSYVVRTEDLPCNRSSPACEANVLLERSLSPGQVFKFRLTVRDTSGDTTTLPALIRATDGLTDFQAVFPHIPGLIMIPEDTRVGSELDYVIVRKAPRSLRPAGLELQGGDEFSLEVSSRKETTTGRITLALPLDYERRTMYKLTVTATGMWTEVEKDSRNAAGLELVVVVGDVQDTPPVWDDIPPITLLSPNVSKGDVIAKVRAVDGDRGSPRDIKYSVVNSTLGPGFFTIHQTSGEIRLSREPGELRKMAKRRHPILVTLKAQEVVPTVGGGSLARPESAEESSLATLALLLGELGNTPPYFLSSSYVCELEENSPQGTVLVFPAEYVTTVRDNDMEGKEGVFALSLEGDGGAFEVQPGVGERQADFELKVRDPALLDYEVRTQLSFQVVAREVSPTEEPLSASARVLVRLIDLNDNPPVFSASSYTAEAPENVTAGYRLTRVEATDADSGEFGEVRYTGIWGTRNSSLRLAFQSGVISIATDQHGFDREEAAMYQFEVEARDDLGRGNRATVPFTLFILDVNDNPPRFINAPFDFLLAPGARNFSQKAIIKLVDDDAEPPNNVVRYEILSGNYGGRFSLDPVSGELGINPQFGRVTRQVPVLVANLTVRAYDLGVPSLSTTTEVRIRQLDREGLTVKFLFPSGAVERRTAEELLTRISGASKVIIRKIEPLSSSDKSMVTATLQYEESAVVDLEELQKRFSAHGNLTSVVINERVVEKERPERSEAALIFWLLLVLLLLLLLALLTLCCCCLCPCCLYYDRLNRLVRGKIPPPEKEILAEKENKSVQAEWLPTVRREAWSAEERRAAGWGPWSSDGSGRGGDGRHWVSPVAGGGGRQGGGGRRQGGDGGRQRADSPRRLLLVPRGYKQPVSQQLFYTNQLLQQRPPLEKRDAVEKGRGEEELLLEEVDGTEWEVLDAERLARRSVFIREGGAEILRLVTRGAGGEPSPSRGGRGAHSVGAETEGKASIMKRFINDTNGHRLDIRTEEDALRTTSDGKQETSIPGRTSTETGVKLDVPQNTATAEVISLTNTQRDILLTRFLMEEEKRRIKIDDTQSLPGLVTMATQTDKHAETQTDKVYFQRRSKSDIDEDTSDNEENGKRRLRRRRVREDIKSPIMEENEEPKTQSKAGKLWRSKTNLMRQAAMFSSKTEEDSTTDDKHDVQNNNELDPNFLRRKEILNSLQMTPVRQVNIVNNVRIEHIRHQDSSTGSSVERGRRGVRTEPASRETSLSPAKYRSSSHGRTAPRYMDWYKTKREQRENLKRDEKDLKYKQQKKTDPTKLHPKDFNPYLRKYYDRKKRKKDTESPSDEKPYERSKIQQENSPQSGDESGGPAQGRQNAAGDFSIVPGHLKNQHALEKKSIFTIAYDDMKTDKIRLDSAPSP